MDVIVLRGHNKMLMLALEKLCAKQPGVAVIYGDYCALII